MFSRTLLPGSDRFLLRVEMGYPGFKHEVGLLKLYSKPVVEVNPMFTPEMIIGLQRKLPGVYGAESLYEYIVQLAEESRKHLAELVSDNPRQQARVDALAPLIADKLSELQQTVDLRKGDHILTIDGQRMHSTDEVQEHIFDAHAGTPATIVYERQGVQNTVHPTLMARRIASY